MEVVGLGRFDVDIVGVVVREGRRRSRREGGVRYLAVVAGRAAADRDDGRVKYRRRRVGQLRVVRLAAAASAGHYDRDDDRRQDQDDCRRYADHQRHTQAVARHLLPFIVVVYTDSQCARCGIANECIALSAAIGVRNTENHRHPSLNTTRHLLCVYFRSQTAQCRLGFVEIAITGLVLRVGLVLWGYD